MYNNTLLKGKYGIIIMCVAILNMCNSKKTSIIDKRKVARLSN